MTMMYKIEVRWGRHSGNQEWSETVCMLTAEKADTDGFWAMTEDELKNYV